MKQLIAITLLTILSMACLGQSMFFNNLEGSIWTSDSNVVDSTVSNISGFGLERLTAHKDSIKTDRTIWLFKEVLTITHYDATTKNETIIGSYDYCRLPLFSTALNYKIVTDFKASWPE
jgi:hypothetical protein